ncbi:MAG: hypothetical protein HXY43_23355 [Fischerella sp.]|jgi:hypothetical protein|uniref:hypothetical protein n=1 Tax=Fischerella sp. TaxID=1191 RepID=UPI00178F712C|nr:hypothetical protein [Fischerella sp.]NWF62111.1 hypothetical protein [Fischerella sp.]
MFLLIFNTGSKDWIPRNSHPESESHLNTITKRRRTACQIAEDLRRIRDNYYLERRNIF